MKKKSIFSSIFLIKILTQTIYCRLCIIYLIITAGNVIRYALHNIVAAKRDDESNFDLFYLINDDDQTILIFK